MPELYNISAFYFIVIQSIFCVTNIIVKNINEVLASPGNISMAYLIPSFIGNFVYFQRENMDKKLTPRGGVWMTSFVASNMAAVSKHDFYFLYPWFVSKMKKKMLIFADFLIMIMDL